MSNYLAIATVTAALRQIIYNAVNSEAGNTTVSILPPDHPELKNDSPRLNLFLYQVTSSAAWQNADLPARRFDGSLATRPQLGLDLYYLLTAYGSASETDPEVHRILGSALRTLHEHPVLTRSDIKAVLTQDSLAQSNLADQIEMIKLTAKNLSLEELSKLWSVFFQTPYRISVAYQASVILIDGNHTPRQSLPVRDRNLYVVPFHQPIIEQVISQDGIDQPIIANSAISIRGQRLRSDITKVRINGIEITPEEVTDTKITLTLPVNLRAGVLGLQVIHQLLIGTPPVIHPGVQFESNVAAFVLHPKITAFEKINPASIKVTFNPKVGRKQRVVLLLNEVNPPPNRQAYAYSFNAPPNNGITDENIKETDIIIFSIQSVNPADYLIRVQVDGAQSPAESLGMG